MPWRRTHNPYKILVSEIMLQQTQVSRVRTKYVGFLKKFPNIKVLARASLGDVLRAWSGLGYNRRARYLHECAKQVVREHDGRFPNDLDELKKLPGIGLSTAGALLAFALEKDEPMIDTNIRRILTRVFFPQALRFDLKNSKGRTLGISDTILYNFAKSLIPSGKGRVWNYAMLDLGATQCTARSHSNRCPLGKLHGRVGDFQHKKPQKKFAHSDRYYRGRIVALLAARNTCPLRTVASVLALPNKRAHRITEKLLGEGLLKKYGNLLRLP